MAKAVSGGLWWCQQDPFHKCVEPGQGVVSVSLPPSPILLHPPSAELFPEASPAPPPTHLLPPHQDWELLPSSARPSVSASRAVSSRAALSARTDHDKVTGTSFHRVPARREGGWGGEGREVGKGSGGGGGGRGKGPSSGFLEVGEGEFLGDPRQPGSPRSVRMRGLSPSTVATPPEHTAPGLGRPSPRGQYLSPGRGPPCPFSREPQACCSCWRGLGGFQDGHGGRVLSWGAGMELQHVPCRGEDVSGVGRPSLAPCLARRQRHRRTARGWGTNDPARGSFSSVKTEALAPQRRGHHTLDGGACRPGPRAGRRWPGTVAFPAREDTATC